ncbi:MAG: hypothetical protein ACRCVN_05100 [Spirochaetia bacterium]
MNKKSFIKLDVDYTGKNAQNAIEQEVIKDVIKEKSYMLQHDIWFANSAIFYTDPQNISATRLTHSLHYILENQDQIACDQSGQICVRSVRFFENYPQVFVNYHVYGDLVKFDDFSEITSIIENLHTDDIAEGNKNFYYKESRLFESEFAKQIKHQIENQTTLIQAQQEMVNTLELIVKNHTENAASNESLGHIKLVSGKIDPILIPTLSPAEANSIGSYVHYACDKIPNNCAILLGGILDPEDFEDALSMFKSRIPRNWITSEGKIVLPSAYDRILQMDPSLDWGTIENDAIRNIKGVFGRFYGSQMLHTGPFALQTHLRHDSLISGGNGTAFPIEFDASRVVPTARKNRENTLNSVIAIITGNLKEVKSIRKYHLIDPKTKEYFGKTISLPQIHQDSHGVGFNPAIMVEAPPIYALQNQLAHEFKISPQSDPLGLCEAVAIGKNFLLSDYVNNSYREFLLDDIWVEIEATQGEFLIRKSNNSHSFLRFICAPTINAGEFFGTKKHIFFSTTKIEIHDPSFTSIAITMSMTSHMRISICGTHLLCSLFWTKSNINSVLRMDFIDDLRERCPKDRLADLDFWLQNFPKDLSNIYNNEDDWSYIWGEKSCRFYMKNENPDLRVNHQNSLYKSYLQASTEDALAVIDAIQNATFNLRNNYTLSALSFFQAGEKIFIQADMHGFSYYSSGGFYIKIPAIPIKDTREIFGSKIVLRYSSAAGNQIFFGGPDLEEISSTSAHNTSVYLIFKENKFILWHADESLIPWGQKMMNSFVSRCSTEYKSMLQDVLYQFPLEWGNNQATSDGFGTISGWGGLLNRRYFGPDLPIENTNLALVWRHDPEKGAENWMHIKDHRGESAYYCQSHYALGGDMQNEMIHHGVGEETIVSSLGELPHYLSIKNSTQKKSSMEKKIKKINRK